MQTVIAGNVVAFLASKILWLAFNPAALFSLFFVLAFILDFTRFRRFARLIYRVLAIVVILFMLLPVGGWLQWKLETAWPAISDDQLPTSIEGILVLGGSTGPNGTEIWGQPIVGGSVERLLSFIKLGYRYPDAKMVFMGGNASLQPGSLTEADVAKEVFADTGFDVSRILFDGRSRNTRENAEYGKELANPAVGETWLLVTSAAHMPRAKLVFDALDWSVLPYPVDFNSPSPHFRWNLSLNGVSRIKSLGAPFHELAGLVYYRLRGWTRNLWPDMPDNPVAYGETVNATD